MRKSQDEYEKDKEIKETTETESYDGYENEAMENAENGSLFEKISLSEGSLSFSLSQIAGSISSSEKEVQLEGSLRDSYEERRKLLLEKWFTVTGKKPRNFPNVKKYFTEALDKIIFFGDKCPFERERKRTEKLLLKFEQMQNLGIVFGKIRQEIRMPPMSPGLQCVRISPNGEFMVTADRNGLVQVRQFPSGQVTTNMKTIEMREKGAIRSVQYHPIENGKIFLGGDAGVIQVCDVQTGDIVQVSNKIGTINTLDFASDASVLAAAGRDGNLRTFDPSTFQEIWAAAWPSVDETITPTVEDEYHRLRIYALKFHPTETNLFVSGANDKSVKIWDVRVPKAIRSIRGPSIFGEGLDLTENKIITGSWQAENSLNLWDFLSGRLIKTVPLQNKSTRYDGEFLYVTQFFRSSPAFPWINSKMVALGGSGFLELVVVNVETDKVLAYFPSFKANVTMDISGNLVVYGGKESTFRVGEVEGGRKTRPHQHH